MPTATRHADPALAAVRAAETVVREAEVATLHAVLAWAAEHTTTDDQVDLNRFGKHPCIWVVRDVRWSMSSRPTTSPRSSG